METNTQNNLIIAEQRRLKSIPAQVFLNHFRAIDYHIRHTTPIKEISQLPLLRSFRPKQEESRLDTTQKWLFNAWNAEYTLRSTAANPDKDYQKYALHWTFPQAYYSVLYSTKAFLAIQGINVSIEVVIGQIINRYVVKGWYPASVSFYADGPWGHYTLHNLVDTDQQALLQPIDTPKQAEAHIAQFLKTTRNLRARAFRQRMQTNPTKALRTKSGKVLAKFGTHHWEAVAKGMGVTTYFDMLTRLKVSGNQRELERFVEADINVPQFHQSLVTIVKYFNLVHECYVVKAIGINRYQQWIEELPEYLREGFMKQRLEQGIRPVFESLKTRSFIQ